MKIAFVGTRGIPANYGGTETYVERLTKYLSEQGDEVIVYCEKSQSQSDKAEADALFSDNVRRVEMPSIPTKHLDNLTRSFFSTLHACLDRSIDVVQFNNVGPAFFSFMPRLFGKKVVGAIRAIDSQREKWNLFATAFLRLCDFLTVKVPHATTVNSTAMQDYYFGKYAKQTLYIPNGLVVPEGEFAPEFIKQFGLERKKYILFAARLEPEKGCHTLIEAFEKIIAHLDTDMVLAVAGNQGFTSDYLSSLKAKSSDRIRFLGFISDKRGMDELYHNAYAFVLPSSVEGMSNSLLNAMAHGIPSVVSDIPENLALFTDLETDSALGDKAGLSFRLWDSDDLAERLTTLLENPEHAALRGNLLREHVRKYFTLDQMCKNTRSVYQDLLERR